MYFWSTAQSIWAEIVYRWSRIDTHLCFLFILLLIRKKTARLDHYLHVYLGFKASL